MLITSIRRSSIALGLFALVTSGILAATQLGTRELILEAERAAAARALLEIVPRDRHSNDLMADRVPVAEEFWRQLGLDEGGDIHIARNQGKPVAIIVPAVAPDGYSGDIKMIVGITWDGSVAGVRVLNHQETPGLGDRIELKKSDWILGFNGKSLTRPTPELWNVKKDKGEFDQFTGATITPRAVVRQVYQTLRFFEANKKTLLSGSEQQAKPAPAGSQETYPAKGNEVAEHG